MSVPTPYLWYGIKSAGMQRMALQNSFQGQPESPQGTVPLHSFHGICRARRVKPAGIRWKQGRYQCAIKAQETYYRTASGFSFFRTADSMFTISCSISRKRSDRYGRSAAGVNTNIRTTGRPDSETERRRSLCRRYDSLARRLIRFRCTARRTARLGTATPKIMVEPAGRSSRESDNIRQRKNLPGIDRPSRNTSPKFFRPRRISDLGSVCDTLMNRFPSGYRSSLTVSFQRPLARRRANTFRPSFDFMRSRNPCVFLRFRLLG